MRLVVKVIESSLVEGVSVSVSVSVGVSGSGSGRV